MQLYSTKHISPNVSFEEAIFRGLPPDNGLYMPTTIPSLTPAFVNNLENFSFQEIAYQVAETLLANDIPKDVLKEIIFDAVNFEAPLVELEENTYVLELFHGPSLAFKDFGARFMARIMSYYLKKSSRKINILVATSGDTGGAVALGFLNTPGIEVTILYPSGKVSELQEKQLTTLGANITALEIDGTFDDCQAMVKQAFLDQELAQKLSLSSANSINIARLIPQSFYYFNTVAQLRRKGVKLPIVFSVPSGNFGNLGAGLIAKRMGLPVDHFIASTNANDIIPQYLETGIFSPRPSIKTISNAMDVGNPSNFARMSDLYNNDLDAMRQHVSGYKVADSDTEAAIESVLKKFNYMMCPHTAVAYLGLHRYLKSKSTLAGVLLATAHPAKFVNELKPEIASKVQVPQNMQELMSREKRSIKMGTSFNELKAYLTSK